MSDAYGWELLCMACADTINSKENALIALLHWAVTKTGQRCIGLGPNVKEFDSAAHGSETLPIGWNLTDGNCTLQYIFQGEQYFLLTVRSDEFLVANFMRSADKEVSSILVNVEETIAATRGTLEEMVPTYKALLHKIRIGLLSPICEGTARDSGTQTMKRTLNPHTLDDNSKRGSQSNEWSPNGCNPLRPLGNVGRSDLDPLAGIGHGGGMVFNPFAEGRRYTRDPGLGIPGGVLPRGAVPPGARFDPFGPLGARAMPDPDNMMPPGYDDLYM